MHFRITNISPLKTALSITALKVTIGLALIILSLIMETGNSVVFSPGNIEQKNPSFFASVFPSIISSTVITFVGVFLGCILFNKINHWWGGVEITLEEKHSNQKIKRTENASD